MLDLAYRLVEIARPTTEDPLWKVTINTLTGRSWTMADPTLRGAISLFRQVRRARCWDDPPIRWEDIPRCRTHGVTWTFCKLCSKAVRRA